MFVFYGNCRCAYQKGLSSIVLFPLALYGKRCDKKPLIMLNDRVIVKNDAETCDILWLLLAGYLVSEDWNSLNVKQHRI